MSENETLLITGSRQTTDRLIRLAKEGVWRAKMLHWQVIVGDAEGIDVIVITECDRLEVPVTVFGAYGLVRHQTFTGRNIPLKVDYLARDERMAALCTKCLALHCVASPTHGTEYTYGCAMRLGREGWIRHD